MIGNSQLLSQRSQQLHQSVTVGRFSRHADAQSAVDLLAERGFPIQHLSIVGTGLKQVDHVVAPLSYAKVAGSGAVQGLFYGAFLALLMMMVTGQSWLLALSTALPIAVAFWMIFAVIAYARRGRHRNFTAVSQLVAEQYELLSAPQEAQEARRLLGGQGAASPLRPQPHQQPEPPAVDSSAGGGAPTAAQAGEAGRTPQGPESEGTGHPGERGQQSEPGGVASPQTTGPESGTPDQGDAERPGDQPPQERPERTQAKDFQDLDDGRPRYGLRDGEDQ